MNLPSISVATDHTLAESIAIACEALNNINTNPMFQDHNDSRIKWERILEEYEDALPSGSGIDTGTQIDAEHSGVDGVHLTGSYHAMDQCGYCGWVNFDVRVRWNANGLDVTVDVDKDDVQSIMEGCPECDDGDESCAPALDDLDGYLAEVYHAALGTIIPAATPPHGTPTTLDTVAVIRHLISIVGDLYGSVEQHHATSPCDSTAHHMAAYNALLRLTDVRTRMSSTLRAAVDGGAA